MSADTQPRTGKSPSKEKEVTINLTLSKAQAERLTRRLQKVFDVEKPLNELLLLAGKTLSESSVLARVRKRAQNRKTPPICARKKYYTSQGSYVSVHQMNYGFVSNVLKKMERSFKHIKNTEGKYSRSPKEAFPSLPGFAGYEDLKTYQIWLRQNYQNQSQS